ncbi:hypothetical protein yc1106_08380 [Curvularia clavata]|uniref:PNPLA domain-containing protein n=1 Tax=Curvularia clavata TaxID=95742 RepID=A0A9Q8ZFE4_CURCL|nr:hypothetical protein yc1106_08380 [Curvularia clavata]
MLPFKVRNGNVKPRYKTEKLEQAIKEVIKDAGKTSDDRFRGAKESACKTVVIALTAESATPIRFTDYKKDGEQSDFYNEVRIWEVARATSAATSFFAPMHITHGGEPRCFLDAGLGYNNPVGELYVEAKVQFHKPGTHIDKQIRVLISIGTGRPALEDFGKKATDVAKSIVRIASDTQRTADTFYESNLELAKRDGYFRFNPTDIAAVLLDEASKKDVIASRTETYGNDPDVKRMIERCVIASGNEQTRQVRSSNADFHALVEQSSSSVPHMKSTPTKEFYSLYKGPMYINSDAQSYWQYLTLDSYYKYERIFHDCKPKDGKVTFESFCKQFGTERAPSKIHVAEAWSRLLRDKRDLNESIHRKPFVMAVLYMLHIETKLELSAKKVDNDEREKLKRFAKWVPCQCRQLCNREWNFVNEIGLSRGGDENIKCDFPGLIENRNHWTVAFKADQVKRLKATREKWLAKV